MRFHLAALALALFATPATAQEQANPPSIVFVTIDGLRWEELFRGADPDLVVSPEARARYVDVPNRPAALAPFLLSFAQTGALIGDRDHGSCGRVTNDFWFSYPGYAEMLSGRPNPTIRSNLPHLNPDITVLERLARRADFSHQVRVFAEWSVMTAIMNTDRSHIPVFTPPLPDEPHDPQVIAAAREITGDLPRVTWVALGDTDNNAHAGDYDAYLRSASESDAFVRELWESVEADPNMAGNTTLIVTTDHGRGAAEGNRWRGHGSGRWRAIVLPPLRHKGSAAVWFAVRGPRVTSTNAYTMENCATTSQVAATLLESVNLLAEEGQSDMAPPLAVFGVSR